MTAADLIIVGAGSAGCVLANRLSRDPRCRVVLLEAGGQDSRKEVKIPAAFSKLFRSEADWNFSTEPEPHLDHRRLYWPRGKMIGGSSSLNAMMYVRGHRSDYDQWRQLGCTGWSYDDVLPYFKKSEGFTSRLTEPAFHGTDGPVTISDQRAPNPMTSTFIDAAVAAGLTRNDDVNGASQDGVGFTHVTQLKGQRWSAADAFLRPARTRSNLSIETDCLVERINIDQGRATGVVIRRAGVQQTFSASRGVVLAAGAVGSPHLLMLSGIGPASHLRDHGIAVAVDSPGVGASLQDHLSSGVAYSVKQPISLAGAETIGNLLRYLFLKSGPLTSNVGEALAFVHTRPGLDGADIELIFAPAYFVGHGAGNPPGHGFTIGSILLRPESRGSIGLATADPSAHPLIHGNYLAAESDRVTLRAGVRFARRVAQQSAFDPIRGEEFMPGAAAESDAELDAAIRARAETLYHPVGTCRMGASSDPLAVVSPRLAVRGVDGLHVADASIMPTIIGGHTHAPTMMIAEKAADLLLEQ